MFPNHLFCVLISADAASKLSKSNVSYRMQGRIVLGKELPGSVNNTAVKDDVVIVDQSGHICVKVWGNEAIRSLDSNESYLKVRQSAFGMWMTTSPKSAIKKIPPVLVELPSRDVLFPTQREVVIGKMTRLGKIGRNYGCGNCSKKSCRMCLPAVRARKCASIVTVGR